MRLVLASASPRRAELLAAAGFDFEILAVDIDERARQGEAPAEYVQRLASEKSAAALERIPGQGPAEAGPHNLYPHNLSVGSGFSRTDDVIVIGADTAVVVDGEILGKPRDEADAALMLQRLAGRSHEVLTGVSVRWTDREVRGVETTTVEFSPLAPAEIAWYAASGEGRDKAGGYGIQGLASRYIPRIAGSYSNVVGLPVALVHELVRSIASQR